jgi:hypothetical protein
MRQEVEVTNRELQSQVAEGFDVDKVNAVIGSITHRSGQVWQNQDGVQVLHY